MKIFVLFVIFLAIGVSMPLAFAENSVSVSIPENTFYPGCEDTNECYIPNDITITVGTVVTWTNDDMAAHTVTSGSPSDGHDGLFDSGRMSPGDEFTETFRQSGNYPYYCLYHPWQTGTVSVVESDNTFEKVASESNFTENSIPDWVKNNFAWFSEGKISESEVLGAIKFLVENDIIQIEQTKKPQTKTFQITLEEVEFWAEVENSVGEKEIAFVELHRWEPNIIVVNKGDMVVLDIFNPRKHVHSLSVPAFDARTGTLEPRTGADTIQFFADKAGTFTFTCSTPYVPDKNYCDPDHSMMTGTLIVLE